MPTRSPNRQLRQIATRGKYARSSGSMLTGGPDYSLDPRAGVDPGSQPPALWWMGSDVYNAGPIGPNGPYSDGHGAALPVVTRATALITGPLTSAPFRVQELGFNGRPLGRPRWVTDPCLLRPDSRFPTDVYPAAAKLGRAAFFSTWLRDACHFGTGAFLCQEDELGQPLAGTLRIVNPFLISCERSLDDGSLRWVIGSGGAGDAEKVVFDRDGYVTLGPVRYRIVALRNPHFTTDTDGHTPGVFEAHPQVFRLGHQVTTYESGTFRSGIPAGYLQVDQSMNSMTQEQAEQLKARWMASHGGDRRSIAVLNAFTHFVPLTGMSPVDAALAEVKRINIGETAHAFGLDALILGVSLGNSATYSSRVDAFLAHRDYSLAPWIAAIQDVLSALLPGTQGVLVDLDNFVNPTARERYDGYSVALTAGILTVDEVREMEGLPPLPEPEPVPIPAPAPEPPVPPETQTEQPPAPPVPTEPTDTRGRRPQPWR